MHSWSSNNVQTVLFSLTITLILHKALYLFVRAYFCLSQKTDFLFLFFFNIRNILVLTFPFYWILLPYMAGLWHLWKSVYWKDLFTVYSLNVKRVKWLLFKRVKSVRTTLTEWKSLSKRVKIIPKRVKITPKRVRITPKEWLSLFGELTEGQLEKKNLFISKWVELDWVSFGKTLFNWIFISGKTKYTYTYAIHPQQQK